MLELSRRAPRVQALEDVLLGTEESGIKLQQRGRSLAVSREVLGTADTLLPSFFHAGSTSAEAKRREGADGDPIRSSERYVADTFPRHTL